MNTTTERLQVGEEFFGKCRATNYCQRCWTLSPVDDKKIKTLMAAVVIGVHEVDTYYVCTFCRKGNVDVKAWESIVKCENCKTTHSSCLQQKMQVSGRLLLHGQQCCIYGMPAPEIVWFSQTLNQSTMDVINSSWLHFFSNGSLEMNSDGMDKINFQKFWYWKDRTKLMANCKYKLFFFFLLILQLNIHICQLKKDGKEDLSEQKIYPI